MMPTALFKQLLLPLYPRLQRVALRLLGNAEDAEDMVQEVYMKLWGKRDELPDVQNVEAYCVTLTKHMCIDRLRLEEIESEDAEDALLPLPATDDVAGDAERQDAVEHVCRIIGTLPESQQQVITLRDMKGLPIEVDDVDMNAIISKLDGLYILTTDKPEIKEALRKETEFITQNEAFECIKSKHKAKEHVARKEVNGYEEIVRIKENGQKMAVYVKEEEDARTEYVLIIDSPDDEYIIMIFTGELQPHDVQSLISIE